MGCWQESSGVGLFSHQEERERFAIPSLTDDINWYLNSALLRNINITKKKERLLSP